MRWIAALGLVSLAATPAAADTVCEWVEFAQAVQNSASSGGGGGGAARPDAARAQTQVALAMFEALNAIDRRYETYLGLAAGDSTASQDIAAATAAYKVLLAHYPSQKEVLDDNYALLVGEVSDGPAKTSAVAIGEAAAALALKAGGPLPDLKPQAYMPRTAPGVWVQTALPAVSPQSLTLKPWILPSVDAVRPPAPPALTSERYARDYEEVRKLGGKGSKDRSQRQTVMSRFRVTPNPMPSFRYAADQPGRRLVENARMFAMLHMITDDAGMANGEAKMFYNFWRPITAIRNGEADGNPATIADPSWEPVHQTPPHQEYPCAHCTYSGAVAEFMKAEVGAKPAWGVRMTSRSLPNAAVQVLPSWDQWVEEVKISRTLGGVHYRFSNEAGEQIGRTVAQMALAKVMRPLKTAVPARKKRS
jgi:hypothetical protein